MKIYSVYVHLLTEHGCLVTFSVPNRIKYTLQVQHNIVLKLALTFLKFTPTSCLHKLGNIQILKNRLISLGFQYYNEAAHRKSSIATHHTMTNASYKTISSYNEYLTMIETQQYHYVLPICICLFHFQFLAQDR